MEIDSPPGGKNHLKSAQKQPYKNHQNSDTVPGNDCVNKETQFVD